MGDHDPAKAHALTIGLTGSICPGISQCESVVVSLSQWVGLVGGVSGWVGLVSGLDSGWVRQS